MTQKYSPPQIKRKKLTPEQIKRKKDHWKRNWKSKGPLSEPKIKRKKLKRRSVRPEPLDTLKRLPLTVEEKTDPRRIKKLKRKKYDLKYSPGPGKATLEKRYQEPLDKHFLREQGPGAPPIPPPQDPIRPRFAGGGKALRGLGRAFVKGGKV